MSLLAQPLPQTCLKPARTQRYHGRLPALLFAISPPARSNATT